MRKFRIRIVVLLVLLLITIAVYFKPTELRNIIVTENINTSGRVYFTIYDISNRISKDVSMELPALMGTPNILQPLLDNVLISGPVLYKKSSINAEIVNLYISLPQKDGNYKRMTMEIIVSKLRGKGQKAYNAFINVGNKGYMVVYGEKYVVDFMQQIQNKSTE